MYDIRYLCLFTYSCLSLVSTSSSLSLFFLLFCVTAAYVIYPLVWLLWEIVIAPARLILAIASYVGILLANIYYVLKGTWSSIGALFQLASVSEATVVTYEVPVWRSLWNDIFSKVICI